MKLNKKGFGVAEIAIVILLIGILAAAVIAGFMGIKKNASEHVKEEATKSAELIHATKHAYPIVIAGNQSGFAINEGEYEVYDLNGYTINTDGFAAVDPTVFNNGGKLFINGEGGTIYKYGETSSSQSLFCGVVYQVGKDAELELNDLKMHFEGPNGKFGYAGYIAGGKATFNNVSIKAGAGFQVNTGAELVYNAKDNTFVMDLTDTGGKTSWYCFNNVGKVTVNGGTFLIRANNTYLNVSGATAITTINGGIFKQGVSGNINEYFLVQGGGKLIINGGTFSALNSNSPLISFSGAGTVEITGGEFMTAPKWFAGTKSSNTRKLGMPAGATITITGGTFRFGPTVGSDGGWGQYVAEGYEAYDLDTKKSWEALTAAERAAVTTWGVRPVGTP